MQRPKVAILMLSWLRFDTLLRSLSDLPKTCSLPLHLILRVQGNERLTDENRKQVHNAARGFHSTDIYFTRDNVGTTAARLDLTHRGAKQGYKYLLFTDDDITFPLGGIEEQVNALDNYPELGAVSLRPRGIKPAKVSDNGNFLYPLREIFIVGSASLMFRSLLYTQHLIAPDSAYYIGTWDWDFVIQIRQTGYKIAMITDKEIINKREGDKEYKQKRSNKVYVRENHSYLISKWGLDKEGAEGIKSKRRITDFLRRNSPRDVFEQLGK